MLGTRIRFLKPSSQSSSRVKEEVFEALGLSSTEVNSGVFDGERWVPPHAHSFIHKALNPSTGDTLGLVSWGTKEDYERCVSNASDAFADWAKTPAPVRGEFIRKLGMELRAKKHELGALLSLEMGKIRIEGEGEVQEFIDCCDMACGQSRMIPGGKVFPSERRHHTIVESWNPLGVMGLITAFNFPHAVFGWNSAISLMCGNTQVVKGAETASLVTVATQRLVVKTLLENNLDPRIATLCQGTGYQGPGEWMSQDDRVRLVSFTGSTRVGREVSRQVHGRFGTCLLELGGNNATIVMPDADLKLALPSVLFSAVGTCAQRCTSLRRLLLHDDIYNEFMTELLRVYGNIVVGDPLHAQVLCGPLHNAHAVKVFQETIQEAIQQGGVVRFGGKILENNFVEPAVIEMPQNNAEILRKERFVPILYVCRVKSFEEAVRVNNQVDQGLTSSLFTSDMKRVFTFLTSEGSDCGIANVNTSCSGAEIGGAFGGNKETGGGRECGSDSWKQYMRRSTSTINFSNQLPLAQGINF